MARGSPSTPGIQEAQSARDWWQVEVSQVSEKLL